MPPSLLSRLTTLSFWAQRAAGILNPFGPIHRLRDRIEAKWRA